MIIKNFEHLSEDEFASLFDPIEEISKNYSIKMAEDYLAFAIAIRYQNNCLLSENLELILAGLINMFNDVSIKEISINNILETLKDKYNLKVTNYNPIEITEL